jgi:hypothetical protein
MLFRNSASQASAGHTNLMVGVLDRPPFIQTACLARPSPDGPSSYRHNAQSITFAIGSLIVHARHTTVDGIDINMALRMPLGKSGRSAP